MLRTGVNAKYYKKKLVISHKSENGSMAFTTKENCTTIIILSFQIGLRQISHLLVAS